MLPIVPGVTQVRIALELALGTKLEHVIQSITEAAPLNNYIGEGLFNLNQRIFNHLRAGNFEIPGTNLMISPWQGYGNRDILSLLDEGYTVNPHGQLVNPDGSLALDNGSPVLVRMISSGLDWDIAMVMREQYEVGALLNNSPFSNDELTRAGLANSYMLNLNDAINQVQYGNDLAGAFGLDFTAVNWAENALQQTGLMPTNKINFDEIDA